MQKYIYKIISKSGIKHKLLSLLRWKTIIFSMEDPFKKCHLPNKFTNIDMYKIMNQKAKICKLFFLNNNLNFIIFRLSKERPSYSKQIKYILVKYIQNWIWA